MALNTIPFLPSDGTITVEDGAGTPVSIQISYEEGDYSISGMKPNDMSVELYRDRGDIFAAREVQQEPVSVSFSAIATEISDATEQCFMDAFLGLGAFVGKDSVVTDTDAYFVKVTWTGDTSGAGAGGEAGQTIVANAFLAEDVKFSEGNPGKFSVSGMAIPIGGTAAVTLT